jgi:hypothetical protein
VYCLVLLVIASSLRFAPAFAADAHEVDVIPGVQLTRLRHEQNILPDREHSGFGSLLYDQHGDLVLHDGHKTWLYTTALFEAPGGGRRDWYGKWVSYAREFDINTHVASGKSLALGLTGEDRWAIIHDVIQVDHRLFVAFYSANGAVRAAMSHTPDGPFRALAGFQIQVTDEWERKGGTIDSLESNGAHVLIEESAGELTIWLGYDSYHVDATAGQLGWAKLRIDKVAETVEFVGKHPGNPLAALPDQYIAARCGGNLGSSLRWGGQHVLLYYSRPSKSKIMLTAALSDDALFQHITKIIELEPPLGDERVIEKFESYQVGNELHVIYENQLASGHWGTGMRVYAVRGGTGPEAGQSVETSKSP